MSLARTYKIEFPPEPAASWKEYEHFIMQEWNNLLNSEPPPTEQIVQNFLELHPSMVPGAFGLLGNESGHYCLYIIGKQQTKILDMLSDAQFERNYKPLPNENIDPDLR